MCEKSTSRKGNTEMSLNQFISDYCPFVARPPARFVTETGARVYGIAAEFTETPQVFHAAEHVRDAGYTKWDVLSPFPIHGIEHAMGIRSTRLPFLAAIAAITGVSFAAFLQWGTTWYLYPTVVQGKPFGAWQPFVPIMFELGVLFTAFMCLFGMLAINGLPRWHHPLFAYERFMRVSNDRFFIVVEAGDPDFDPAKIKKLLQDAGGANITLIEDID